MLASVSLGTSGPEQRPLQRVVGACRFLSRCCWRSALCGLERHAGWLLTQWEPLAAIGAWAVGGMNLWVAEGRPGGLLIPCGQWGPGVANPQVTFGDLLLLQLISRVPRSLNGGLYGIIPCRSASPLQTQPSLP